MAHYEYDAWGNVLSVGSFRHFNWVYKYALKMLCIKYIMKNSLWYQ